MQKKVKELLTGKSGKSSEEGSTSDVLSAKETKAKVERDEAATELKEKIEEYKELLGKFRNGEAALEGNLKELQEEMQQLKNKMVTLLPDKKKETFPESLEGFAAISEALENLYTLGEIMYHSPQKLQEKLKEAGMEIPVEEITRMEAMIAGINLEEVKTQCAKLKEHTEGNKPPLLMILPQKVMVRGEIIDCTIENLKENLWPKLQAKNSDLKGLYLGDHVTSETKTRKWSEQMIAYTSATLQNSKSKSYDEQKQLVVDILGEDATIRAEMYPAMIFHYLLTGELLMIYDEDGYMRSHELDKDGDPLYVDYDTVSVNLFSRNANALDDAGIGSSVVFSRGVST